MCLIPSPDSSDRQISAKIEVDTFICLCSCLVHRICRAPGGSSKSTDKQQENSHDSARNLRSNGNRSASRSLLLCRRRSQLEHLPRCIYSGRRDRRQRSRRLSRRRGRTRQVHAEGALENQNFAARDLNHPTQNFWGRGDRAHPLFVSDGRRSWQGPNAGVLTRTVVSRSSGAHEIWLAIKG